VSVLSRVWVSVMINKLPRLRKKVFDISQGPHLADQHLLRPVTKRERGEGTHRAAEERYRLLFERNPAGVFRSSCDGHMLDCNESFARLLGYASRDEILARTVWEFYPSVAAAQEFIARLQAHRSLIGFELSLRRRNGSLFWVLANVSLFEGENGTPEIIEGVLVDITERKQAEQTLRDSEEKYRTLFEESTDAIAITTPGGEFILVNQAWLDLFGYTREEITELNIAETYLQAHDQTVLRQRIEQPGSAKHYELKLRKKDGKQMDCLLAMKVWRAKDGSILGYQSIVQDITDRKQTEKSLRDLSGRLLCLQDEERRRLARELHDATGQSLAALMISLTQIKQSGTVRDPRLHNLLLESLELAGQSAREIRTLSYLLHPPLLDELGLTSALYYYAEGFAKRSGIHVSLDVPAKLGRLPRELETTVFRIVQESLTNIHRHSRSATAGIRIVRNATDLTLEVSDEGNGMSPAVLERSNGGGGGLGVGIAGMCERARQLGGQLAIDASGHGVKVRAILPLSGGQ